MGEGTLAIIAFVVFLGLFVWRIITDNRNLARTLQNNRLRLVPASQPEESELDPVGARPRYPSS
jgi:hypothetical protein